MRLHTWGMGAVPETAALLRQLRDHLGYRRIERGIATLESIRIVVDALEPGAGAGVLLGLIAQWVDAGFDSPAFLAGLLERFPAPVRSSLPLLDYLHLRMAEGVLAMSGEDYESAETHFRFVQAMEGEVGDAELLAIANFWAGRCLRKAGRYDDALSYTIRGEELALSLGYAQMAAIMMAARSWLAFQKGKLGEAADILRHAEEALSPTDDYLSRGNIQSAYGRIARRQGRFERAQEYFERAIREYRLGGHGDLQTARALTNLGYVKRLLALQVQRELDRVVASRRGGSDAHGDAQRMQDARLRVARIRGEACAHLAEALAIYTRSGNHRGIASVHVNQGLLYVDAGDLEHAAAEGAEAFRHGHEKRDFIVMARARTLQCMVENAAVEEQVGDTSRHHEAAEAFARDAVNFAGETQNRRLLARAYVWQGLTFSAEQYRDEAAARRCCEQAAALLQPEGLERQYIWEDLETLKTRVLHARPVDPMLRAWSAGIVDGKTFQEMTEEFARLVIPKVWEREGRKVSRVAEKLSISPKKVRRILHAAGLLGREDPGQPAT